MRSSQAEAPPRGGAEPLSKPRIAELLDEARRRTLELVAPVSEADMDRVHDPLMSPLVWDLGHIAAFEDLWLCQRAGGLEPLRPDLSIVYDASETPRPERGRLPYLRVREARDYMEAVRERSLAVLEEVDLSEDGGRLNARGFVWEMLVHHEHQHTETMLQTLQLAEAGVYSPPGTRTADSGRSPAPEAPPAQGNGVPPVRPALTSAAAMARRPRRTGAEMVRIEAGAFFQGAAVAGFAYDNERPQHEVELPAFAIDRLPVTNGAYRAWIEDGGYQRPEWWSPEGWGWRQAEGIERPLYWTQDGRVRSFDRVEPLDPDLPVMHVSWYEAEAFARARGKRLPTEAEWERAASWDAADGVKRRFPWGDDPPGPEHATLDQLSFGPAAVEAHPAGASREGALGLIGDAWEWTASSFRGYPGFSAFPYRDYSEAFFGPAYRVLRGGSWATRPRAIRATFRNWDFPSRRQLFAGFRCAVDA